LEFYGICGKNEDREKLSIHKLSIMDIPLIEEWIDFDSWCTPNIEFPSERCNWLGWDYIFTVLNNFEGEFFKVISTVTGVERLEGIIHIIPSDGETVIEALEVAPWNRVSYLGDEREFRNLGLILIGYAILYGKSVSSCGRIRLESLEVREPYYRDGLGMREIRSGEFIYTETECNDFIGLLNKYEMLK
jgi:hypothetical protein